MNFRIADTFQDSLARLTSEAQKAVKSTAFDLQMNPAHPSFQFHKLEKPKDPRFWSLRVNLDLRIIVHRMDNSLLLCYVDHHDAAYQWALRRKLDTHPKTGAAQLVEVEEVSRQVETRLLVAKALPSPLAGVTDEELLGYGVPPEWIPPIRAATEDTLLDIAARLPGEAAEALLTLATGSKPKVSPPAAPCSDPFQHPDAQRRFRVMRTHEELERALEYPWEKWTVFLHPEQRQLVERDYKGPARVAGSAGTGKTIVALHRAVFLAHANPDARVLLTTFSEALSNALGTKLRRLIGSEPRLGERLEVHGINALGTHLYELNFERPALATRKRSFELLLDANGKGGKFSQHFLFDEWHHVVDAWQLQTWEAYRDVARLGRKTRLSAAQRIALWSIFERVWAGLKSQALLTEAGMFHRLAEKLSTSDQKPFDFAVVDEAQDVSVAQLRFLAALSSGTPNSLFFAGDLGQRIFQQPFSWKALGVDVRGRSFTLRTNYRTSHQIRKQADRLLESEVSDVDGNTEERKGTISTFNGQPPDVIVASSHQNELQIVSDWLRARAADGVIATEIGIFVRSNAQLARAKKAAESAGLAYKVLDENVETISGFAAISTMHLAKGLEFRAVAVMACDDEVIPLQRRIESASDAGDLEEVYATERHLLYVACTRARDHLLVSGVNPASEFLVDLEW